MTIPKWNQKDHGYGSGFDLRDVVKDDPYIHRWLLEYFRDREIAYRISEVIREKWPQFNTKTKIALINDYQFNIVTRPPSSIQKRIRTAISGWRNLKHKLFHGPTLAQLDDPQTRIRYSHQLWSAIFKAPTYLIWRILGKVFRKSIWYNRGTETTIDPISDLGTVTTIRLERLGVQAARYDGLSGYDLQIESIVCTYYPPTDTFYVYKRR